MRAQAMARGPASDRYAGAELSIRAAIFTSLQQMFPTLRSHFLRFVEMSPRIAMIPTRAAISMKIGPENHHYSRTVPKNRQRQRASNDQEQTNNVRCEVDAAILKMIDVS
jgi:hypothetical protein